MSIAQAEVALAHVPSDTIGRKAVCALYSELALYPKPGLVSFVDNGAHDDMDGATFMRSLAALRNYFQHCAVAGSQRADFDALRRLGLAAETRMMQATRGTNTHRGAIFTMGLLAAAAGRLSSQKEYLGDKALGRAVSTHWGASIQASLQQAPMTHGLLAVRRYGVGGARDQAATGFPLLFDLAIPALQATLRSTGNRERARVQTLFVLMSELDDTNVLHRAGAQGLAYLKSQARTFLNAGGVHARDWHERATALHQDCIAHRISPGGSADLLAAAIFVSDLLTGL